MPTYQHSSGTFHFSGDLGPHCAECSALGAYLCDYPIGGGLTCDRSMCESHGFIVGDDIHYCLTHYRQWQANNPDQPAEYCLTRYRQKTLPGMAFAAMTFLKEEFDKRDPGSRDQHVERFLKNSAIQLGADADRAGRGEVDDAPHESLAGGLSWCISHGLIQVCWRKPPGWMPAPWFALTKAGLSVMEGEVVERISD